jgi:hypothetical protein
MLFAVLLQGGGGWEKIERKVSGRGFHFSLRELVITVDVLADASRASRDSITDFLFHKVVVC